MKVDDDFYKFIIFSRQQFCYFSMKTCYTQKSLERKPMCLSFLSKALTEIGCGVSMLLEAMWCTDSGRQVPAPMAHGNLSHSSSHYSQSVQIIARQCRRSFVGQQDLHSAGGNNPSALIGTSGINNMDNGTKSYLTCGCHSSAILLHALCAGL